jgi:hypothetical protein
MKALITFAACITLAVASTANAKTYGSRVYVPVGCGKVIKLVYKPRAVCIFGKTERIVWTSYGGSQALGRLPNDRYCGHACTVTLFRIRRACGRRIYTRLGIEQGDLFKLRAPRRCS